MSSSIFILKASGPSLFFQDTLSPICSRAFSTREAAEAHEAQFRLKCVTQAHDDDIAVLEKVVRFAILELTLD